MSILHVSKIILAGYGGGTITGLIKQLINSQSGGGNTEENEMPPPCKFLYFFFYSPFLPKSASFSE